MSQASVTGTAGVLCFLIADIRGYTSFTRTRGSERAAELATAFAALCREAVEAHDGTVIELRGDEALATFSSPRQALRAATQLQIVAADESALNPELPLNVGIGIDVGEAVPVEDGYRGEALNFAARLCSAAGAGEILASEAVSLLAGGMDGISVETVEGLSLKGIPGDITASRIVASRPSGPLSPVTASVTPVELDPLTPMFGRDVEARSLRWAWRAARRGDARAVVIGGPTGVGKTRLASDAASLASRDNATISYSSAFGSNVAASLERFASSTGPTLLVLDDMESATDDDLAALRAATSSLPPHSLLIVIATDDARAEAAAALRALAARGKQLSLRPIAQDAVAQIVAGYATDADGPAPVAAIVQASGGIPAQVHELAATWARQQATRRLGAAAARTADGRRDLRQLESEVANNVIDLQAAQARLNLIGRSERKSDDLCPYKGLVAFDVGDANFFYGRERLIAEMIGRLAGANFLAVVGPSGSGKSSAVRAGLLPALATGALPGADAWHQVIVRPGAHPVREIDRVLYASVNAEQREQLSRSVAADSGEQPRDPLADVASVLPQNERILIVVDQFEEIFTIADPGERDEFVGLLEKAAATDIATVVLALRADFYGRCAAYPHLAELLGAGHILVGPMSATEYARAIEGPARRAGLTIDPALVDALVLDVLDQPGALPLLSTALVELWERREGRAIRLSAYAATGGVRGAVGRLAEAAYCALDDDEQLIARGLFLRLSAGEGDSVVRRRVPLAELDVDNNPRVAGVVKKLTEARLITVGEGNVEVAHEALLREWPRLAAWLEEDRAARRLREHLVTAAREWDAAGHDPGELYRGTRLAAAIDWTTDHTLELNETERSFLAESRAAAARDADRQRRANRRLRILLAAAGIALLVAVGAGVFAYSQGQAAQTAATVADAQRLGAQALIQSDLDVSLLLARQGVAFDNDAATRADLLSAVVRSPAAIGAWRPVSGRPLGVSASPDGRYLLIWNNKPDVALVDASTGAVVRDLGPGFLAQFAPDGRIVVGAGQGDGAEINVSTVDDPTPTLTVDIPAGTTFSISPDLKTLGTVDADMLGITLKDMGTGDTTGHIDARPNTTLLDIWGYSSGILGVVHEGLINGSDQLNAAYSQPVTLDWWPTGSTTPSASIPVASGNLDGSWAVDPAATEIAVPDSSGNIAIYSLPDGKNQGVAMKHNSLIGMTFSPDGKTLVSGGDDKLLQVWDVATGRLRETLAGHAGRVFAPALSDAGGHLTAWSVSLDGQLIEWDLTGDRRINRPVAFGSGATDDTGNFVQTPIAVSPDGRFVAAPNSDGKVTILDAHTLQSITQLQAFPPDAFAMAVAFSPDSKTLAVGGQGSQMLTTWDTAAWTSTGANFTGPPANRPVDPSAPPGTAPSPNNIGTVAWSPDGKYVAGGTADGGIYLWNLAGGAPAQVLTVPGDVFRIDFAPDSASVVAAFAANAGAGGRADVLSLSGGAVRYEVSVDDDYGTPFAASFSHDGKLLATGGGTGQVRFWDATSGAAQGSVFGNAGWVTSLSFNSDDSLVATSGTDGTIRLLDPATHQQLGASLPGGDADSEVAIGPDNRVFADYTDDGHGYVWDISLASLESHACSVAGRALTQAEWGLYVPGRPYNPACTQSGSQPGASTNPASPASSGSASP